MTELNVAEYCLGKLGASEGYPFGPDVCVMKVNKKLFALMSVTNRPNTINLKCDPVRAMILRQEYPEITPGYHMNKDHWNTIDLTGNLSNELVCELIDNSYDLVAKIQTK
jgi:predicted DNA-binding protein (MmcQ/YjbR family)